MVPSMTGHVPLPGPLGRKEQLDDTDRVSWHVPGQVRRRRGGSEPFGWAQLTENLSTLIAAKSLTSPPTRLEA